MSKYGPRRSLSHSERILRAIKMARMRFEDDQRFLEEVHRILLMERVLTEEQFGIYAKRKRDVDDDDDDRD